MTLDSGTCSFLVQGKLQPSWRGQGAQVRLLCESFGCLDGGPCLGRQTFPSCDSESRPPNVDSCGNFNFIIPVPVNPDGSCPTEDQIQAGQIGRFCIFVAHVNIGDQPSLCGNTPPSANLLPDPNGTAPCSGGYCPIGP